LLADVDLLPQHQTFLHHQHFFHDRDNRRAILLTHWHGTIYHTLHRHTRDGDFVVKQWFIDTRLVLVYHLGNSDLACLDQPLLHLQLFHQHRYHQRLVLRHTVLAAIVLKLCQAERQVIAPIRLLD
jgi:hypothetical protein